MMEKPLVVFIALQEFDNLGVGYIAARLSEEGFESRIIDFRRKKEEMLKIILDLKPVIVGFSVIYQYYISLFTDLIDFLRKSGINCHFTAGGHYASVRYYELFELIQGLDSIVRFEGEYTFPEMAKMICSGGDLKNTKGIAFRQNGEIITTALRPLEKDLDRFPYPLRSPLTEYAFNRKFATIIAGRGCINNCSFCNLKEFFRIAGGPLKRLRNPEMVVREMDFLFNEKKCSVFLFMDDDFPVKTEPNSEWLEKFCKALRDKRLHNKVLWKINCRPDEVDEEAFKMMKNHGLYLVFLGIDDGTNEGLRGLNKHLTIEKSLEGINILKKRGIGFDYGFMLFQPSSTYVSINDNLEFLRRICGDGYTPLTFLKLMPYYETGVEKDLIRDKRLKYTPGSMDYDFLQDSLNHYYSFVTDCFSKWLRANDGLTNISKWARNYLAVFSKYFKSNPEMDSFKDKIRKTVSESNLFILDTMKELASKFESDYFEKNNKDELEYYKMNINSNHENFKKQIHKTMTRLLYVTPKC